MKVTTAITLSREEIEANLPYALICMTREGATWNTTRRRRRWKTEFSEDERKNASQIFQQSHSWLLKKGVPDEITITGQMLSLWIKVGGFCATL